MKDDDLDALLADIEKPAEKAVKGKKKGGTASAGRPPFEIQAVDSLQSSTTLEVAGIVSVNIVSSPITE